MARDLTGKTVVVVGASGVLGAQFVQQLHGSGAIVKAIVRDESKVDSALISAYAVADVTSNSELAAAFTKLAPFDGVINATGVVAFGLISDLDDETLRVLFAVNATAPLVMLRESSKHLGEGGFFVNLSGVVAQQPMAGMAAYSASKASSWAAMIAATRELRRQQIDVIDARPPHTETGLATRPLAGIAPKLPIGLEPSFVAARIITAIKESERDLPVEAFAS